MAGFDVKKVLIANIKVPGVAATFPMLHIVVTNTSDVNMTADELRAFVQTVCNSVGNYQIMSGGWFDKNTLTGIDPWQGLSTGTHEYGNATGFKIKIRVTASQNITNGVNLEYTYKDSFALTANPSTGYSISGFAYPCIITDENGILFMSSAFGPGTSPFRALEDNITESQVVDGVYLTSAYLSIFSHNYYEVKNRWNDAEKSWSYKSNYNITNDIDSEIDPSQPPNTDPYNPGGENEPGGGDGPFGPNGEDITDPALPDVDAVSTGFITLFNPTVSQLNSLASYMWSGGFDVDTFKKIFANPMDCILGLSILPKIVPAGGSANILVGNIDTGVSMTKAAKQYVKFDCGSINIARYTNSFLDYSPYTKIYLYLPFIGIREISTDDVMNKSLHVKYSIDILSGACVAFVIAGGTTLYSYIGQCAASVPITGSDWSTMINGVLGAVGSIASTVGSFMTGNLAGGIGGIASTAQNVLGSKPDIQHSGSMGGMGGMLGIKTPYVIIERPAQAVPSRQNEYIGYPSFVTKDFADLQGYNEIYATHLHDIPCTENELQEIESLLKSGVIF